MKTLKELRKCDLFTFFRLSETGRIKEKDGVTRVTCEPGGFQKNIDIEFSVGKGEVIQEATIFLERAWIGNENTVNPFGKDIARSFLADVLPQRDRELLAKFLAALWQLRGKSDQVISIRSPPPPVTDPDALRGISVYLGKESRHEYHLAETAVILENIERSGSPWLRIRVIKN
ncbi:MAG: hypothetical protein HXY34_13205 [Candidatus Thorarchaeota archaeon]|nr:hypothetical protein [Candidatus Thorarchaeota archaeon]